MWDVFDVVIGLYGLGFSRCYMHRPSWYRNNLEVAINNGDVMIIVHTDNDWDIVWDSRAPVLTDDFVAALANAAIKWEK